MAESNEDGVLLHGSDNEVYFIPSDRLAEFRVEGEAAADARAGFDAMEDDVAGFALKGFDLKPGVVSLTAFRGPLAVQGERGTLGKTKKMYSLG